MQGRQASRTAVLTCQGRAVAQGRLAIGRFDDPTAITFLHDDERAAVELVRSGGPPRRDMAARMSYESMRAIGEVMAPRTVEIDDAVRAHPSPQVVILGAGLDGRAWRMPELATVAVFEVDHPASQDDKRARAGAAEPLGPFRYVPVDFTRRDLGAALAAAGHDAAAPTTWIWEGVVSYLGRAQVEATVEAVSARSAAGSRLVVNYQAPSLRATFGLPVAELMSWAARQRSVWRDEPRRSAWRSSELRALLARHHFTVSSDRDLLTIAVELGIEARGAGLRAGRVAVADRSA